MCSISVDNASYNDSAVTMLKDSLSFYKRLPLNDKLFHVRCCAHILNLLVHDGLSEIENVIDNVRASVKHITTSTMRLTMFSDIVKQLQLPNKSLYELYKEHVDENATANVGTSMENDVHESGVSNASTTSRIGKRKVMTGRSKAERYIRSVDTVDN
ncbi:hypothetical protein Goarm_022424, partial [Gossypium armourianum]|nr:hypothetical protein [Gossypium armourianum]